MHRQAVKSKAEGLYFKVRFLFFFLLMILSLTIEQASTLQLFKTILDDQKNLPREQPYKDLLSLINFVLRQFFKAMTSDSFLAIEVSSSFFLGSREPLLILMFDRRSSPKTAVTGNSFPVGNLRLRRNVRVAALPPRRENFLQTFKSRKGLHGARSSGLLSLVLWMMKNESLSSGLYRYSNSFFNPCAPEGSWNIDSRDGD